RGRQEDDRVHRQGHRALSGTGMRLERGRKAPFVYPDAAVPAKAGTHPEMSPTRRARYKAFSPSPAICAATLAGWTPAFAGVAIVGWGDLVARCVLSPLHARAVAAKAGTHS